MSNNIISSIALLRELQHDLYEIARYAELGDGNSFTHIQERAEQALKLIDSVMLTSQVESGQVKLDLAPIGLGSVMHDAAYQLRLLSGQPVSVKAGINSSVSTNPELLNGFLYCSGSFIKTATKHPILLRSYEAKDRVGIGAFVKGFDISQSDLKSALKIMNTAQMPMAAHSNRSGVLLLVAAKIAQSLGSEIMVKNMGRYKGFCITLPKSQQLSLIAVG